MTVPIRLKQRKNSDGINLVVGMETSLAVPAVIFLASSQGLVTGMVQAGSTGSCFPSQGWGSPCDQLLARLCTVFFLSCTPSIT